METCCFIENYYFIISCHVLFLIYFLESGAHRHALCQLLGIEFYIPRICAWSRDMSECQYRIVSHLIFRFCSLCPTVIYPSICFLFSTWLHGVSFSMKDLRVLAFSFLRASFLLSHCCQNINSMRAYFL